LLFVAAACTPAGSEVVPTPTTPSEPTTEPTIEPTDEPALEPAPTDGIHWSLIHTIVGGDAIVPIPADVIAYLQTEGELVSGKSGCNTFSGTAIVEGNRLSFGPLATTRMACPEEQTAFETEFLNLLSKVAIYKLTDGNLELQNNDGLPLALFAPATEQTLFVGPEQVDCTGVAPQKCLLVKEEPGAENTFFYNSIVGFNWEAGYEYELRVNVVSIPNPLADASSLRYELVEVIDRSAVEAPDTTNLVGTVWQWIRFDDFGEINSFEVADPTNYTIKFPSSIVFCG
jgi:heat shock protein HslJ